MNTERVQQLLTDCPAGPQIACIAPPAALKSRKLSGAPQAPPPGRTVFCSLLGEGWGSWAWTCSPTCSGSSVLKGGEAVLAEMGLGEEGRHPYNEGLLALLPKKPVGAEPRGIPYLC